MQNIKLQAAINKYLMLYEKLVPSETLEEFMNLSEADLCFCHFGLGLYLRNHVLLPDSDIYKLFVINGITHPDNMSYIMVKTWRDILRKTMVADDKLL